MDDFQIKTFRQLLGLPNNTPRASILVILGAEPIEASLHKKALGVFGSISRQRESIEWKIFNRQLAIKSRKSRSWIQYISSLLVRYSLPSVLDLWSHPPSKNSWRKQTWIQIERFWEDDISSSLTLLSSMK